VVSAIGRLGQTDDSYPAQVVQFQEHLIPGKTAAARHDGVQVALRRGINGIDDFLSNLFVKGFCSLSPASFSRIWPIKPELLHASQTIGVRQLVCASCDVVEAEEGS
jgi:hypothetical protein